MNEFNFSLCAASLIKTYLENRSQVVFLNKIFSSYTVFNKDARVSSWALTFLPIHPFSSG